MAEAGNDESKDEPNASEQIRIGERRELRIFRSSQAREQKSRGDRDVLRERDLIVLADGVLDGSFVAPSGDGGGDEVHCGDA